MIRYFTTVFVLLPVLGFTFVFMGCSDGYLTTSDEDVARLERRFEKRIKNVKPKFEERGSERWRNPRFSRSEREILYGADILIKVEHPKAFDYFEALLYDPLFTHYAAKWLVKLGDPRGGKALYDRWEKNDTYPFVWVNSFVTLPYEPAIPKLIDVFGIYMDTTSMEAIFKAIETCSGEDLSSFRTDRLYSHKEVDELKARLHQWHQSWKN